MHQVIAGTLLLTGLLIAAEIRSSTIEYSIMAYHPPTSYYYFQLSYRRPTLLFFGYNTVNSNGKLSSFE